MSALSITIVADIGVEWNGIDQIFNRNVPFYYYLVHLMLPFLIPSGLSRGLDEIDEISTNHITVWTDFWLLKPPEHEMFDIQR